MISAIIPTYRNPKYLDICLKSAVENRQIDLTQIIVVLDGFIDESREVVEKYQDHIGLISLERNSGMANAINMAVWQSTNPTAFIVNDDNIFPKDWDARLAAFVEETLHGTIFTVNQVEPEPSIFNFPAIDCGKTAEDFNFEKYYATEESLVKGMTSDDGRIFPFLISKKHFMMVGGFDVFYQSPFFVDVDFWLKLELAGLKFKRLHHLHLYHFGSRATKLGNESLMFKQSETVAAQQFAYKWGYLPNIIENVKLNNTKFPSEAAVRGVSFSQEGTAR